MRVGRVTVTVIGVIALSASMVAFVGGAAGSSGTFQLGAFPHVRGAVTLHVDGPASFVRYDTAVAGGGVQTGPTETFTTNGCAVVAPFPSSLRLGVTATSTVGLSGPRLGERRASEGNGTGCAQVNAGESVTIAPGSSLTGAAFDRADIGVEARQGAAVRAQLYLGGTLVRTDVLASSGTLTTTTLWRVPVAPTSPVLFDQVRLSVDPSTPAGSMSVKGGSGDSVFEVVDYDGTLACGSTVSSGGTGGTPSVTLTLQSTSGCQSVPYILDTSNQGGVDSITFQKAGGTANQYAATFVWPPEAAASPLPATQVAYAPGPSHDLQWCLGTTSSPVLPSGEFWCLLQHQAVIVGSAQVQVTEQVFGQGDPGFWR